MSAAGGGVRAHRNGVAQGRHKERTGNMGKT
jgi:hypothetical protein